MSSNEIEEWARSVVAHHLDAEVVLHDDGSRPSMYDLRIGSPENPAVVIEVTMAADPRRLAAGKLLPEVKQAPELLALWVITVAPSTRQKGLFQRLVPVLRELENRYPLDWLTDALRTVNSKDQEILRRLGVMNAARTENSDGGRLAILLPPSGGVVDRDGSALSHWIGEFLVGVPDVLKKLGASNAQERHAFVPVAVGGASWEVESFLWGLPMRGDGKQLPPAEPPALPDPVTSVWVVGTGARVGWLWDGQRWDDFQAAGPPVDDR